MSGRAGKFGFLQGKMIVIEIAVCDDELYLLRRLEKYLLELGKDAGIQVEVECYEDGSDLVKAVTDGKRFEIIYLDVRMKYMNGLEAAYKIREIDRMVQMVYVTSHDGYMKETFRVAPIGFLTKPIKKNEFEETFYYVLGIVEAQDSYYRFRYMKSDYKVAIRDILYFESKLRVAEIALHDGFLKEYRALNEIEKSLDQSKGKFLRIHKSYLVNYQHVIRMGYEEVEMPKGIILPLSRAYKKAVDEKLRQFKKR